MAELKTELQLQSSPLLPLSDEEFEALKTSIKKDGVRVPVILGEHMLIDGRHRWRACAELGLREIPTIFLPGLSAREEHEIAITVNAIRRHLNREQKQSLVRAELMRDVELDVKRSDVQIAVLCGVSHPTVRAIRDKMIVEASVQPDQKFVEKVSASRERRQDTRGRIYEVDTTPIVRQVESAVEQSLGRVRVEQPGLYDIYRDGGGLRAERVG